jgi:hypothetical protein
MKTPAETFTDWIAIADTFSADVAEAFGDELARSDIRGVIAELVGFMSSVEDSPELGVQTTSFPRVLQHIAIAKGLIRAARHAATAGDDPRAMRLENLGLLFLHYATLDLAAADHLALAVNNTTEGDRINAIFAACRSASDTAPVGKALN